MSDRQKLLPTENEDHPSYGSASTEIELTISTDLIGPGVSGGGPTPRNAKDEVFVESDDLDANNSNLANKITRTGRQRKKLAARTKGGEFQAKRKKRRVYFCCICSEVDLEGLHDAMIAMGSKGPSKPWITKMYEDVLHVFLPSEDDLAAYTTAPSAVHENELRTPNLEAQSSTSSEIPYDMPRSSNLEAQTSSSSELLYDMPRSSNLEAQTSSSSELLYDVPRSSSADAFLQESQSASLLWASGSREVFVFEFGVAVFWGFHRGDEEPINQLIRQYVEQGLLDSEEFLEGQDDMAFVTASDTDAITVANDVITLPDDTSSKSRLSISFAIAQSAVLNIFEARIERRVKEYKYIPETLAETGRVRLSPKKLGTMIGEVYRIRHDVNLHTEILDTPDFFWKEEGIIAVYQLTARYLEMTARTEVLNKRLDMLRELLYVLQQKQQSSASVKLEWIVIWLIVISAAVETCAIAVQILKP